MKAGYDRFDHLKETKDRSYYGYKLGKVSKRHGFPPYVKIKGASTREKVQPHPFTALRQTSSWMILATLAPPESGSLHVKASGIDSFFWRMKASRASSMPWSSAGAS